MAQITLNVYYNNVFAGKLIKKQLNISEFQFSFQYDINYINNNNPLLSYRLPLREDEYIHEPKSMLLPYFDNLTSEGWLRDQQYEDLKINEIKEEDKFSILSYFGYDLIGSVSIKRELVTRRFNYSISNEQSYSSDSQDSTTSIGSISTISDCQKKLLVKKNLDGLFKVTNAGELSTHIAKLECGMFEDLIELEYLSSLAVKHLLPDDVVCNLEISKIHEFSQKALIIERFDRIIQSSNTSDQNNNEIIINRRHFEEFNQLFNLSSENKYESSYDDMAVCIYEIINMKLCTENELLKLFMRILVFILIGNTDAHLKNFGMFHETDGSLRLTPMYDVVASAYYKQFNELALKLNNQKAVLSNLKPKDIVDFAINIKGFHLSKEILVDVVKQLEKNKYNAIQAIENDDCARSHDYLKEKLTKMIEKRWNGTFKGIEGYLKKMK